MIVVRFCLLKVRVHVALHHYFLDYAEERVNNDKNEVAFPFSVHVLSSFISIEEPMPIV